MKVQQSIITMVIKIWVHSCIRRAAVTYETAIKIKVTSLKKTQQNPNIN